MDVYLRIGKVNKIGNAIDKLGLDGLFNCKYPLLATGRNESLSRVSRLSRFYPREATKHHSNKLGENKPTGNAFHVAIQSKQSTTIKLLMERILSQFQKDLMDENKNPKDPMRNLRIALGDKVYDGRINSSHSSLAGMNAVHLACIYYPRAIIEINDAIEAWLVENEKKFRFDVQALFLDLLQSVLEDQCGITKETPVHIAATKDLIEVLR